MPKSSVISIKILADAKQFVGEVKGAEDGLGRFAKAIGGISAVSGAVGGALYAIGSQFDAEFDKIRVGTGATGDQLAALEDTFKGVLGDVPASFEEAGTAVADLNTRLGLTGEPLEELSEKFVNMSRITGEDLSGGIESITRVFGDWGVEVGDQADVMDKFYRASQASGAGIGDLSEKVVQFGAPLRNLGFDFDESLAMFAEFDKQGVNTETVFAGLRAGVGKLAKAGEDVPATFRRVVEEIESLGPGSEATGLAIELFGQRAGPDLADAITGGKFALDDMMGAITGGGDTINNAAADTMDFAEQWQLFKNRTLVVLEPIASRVFGLIGDAMEYIGERAVPKIREFSEQWSSGTGKIGGFRDTLRNLWEKYLQPVGEWLLNNKAVVASFVGTIAALLVLNKVTNAVKAFNLVLRANPIGLVITAVAALVAGLVWLYRNNETARRIMDAAWVKIKAVISSVVGWIVNTGWPWLRDALKKAGEVAMGLWRDYIGPAFGWIWEKAKDVFGWIKETGWPLMRDAISKIAEKATWLWESAIKPTFGFLKDGISAVVSGFQSARDGIGRAWEGIVSRVKGPVNAVMDFLRRYFVNPLNSLLSKIPGVDFRISLPGGSGPRTGSQTSSGGRITRASGGVLPGWSPGRDNMHWWSPVHGGLSLSGGEAIMRPEWTKAVGSGWVDRMNALARSGGVSAVRSSMGFAGGGVVSWLKEKGSDVIDWGKRGLEALMNPVEFLKNFASRALSGIGSNMFAQAAGGVGRKAASEVASWIKNSLFGGFGESGGVPPGGRSSASLERWVEAIPGLGARVTSGYRPGSRTAGSGATSMHALGRAIDIVSSRMSVASLHRAIARIVGLSPTELIGPVFGLNISRGTHRWGSVTNPTTLAGHKDHVHLAYRSGGLAPFVADAGALIPPGVSLLENRTGGPEPLVRGNVPLELSDATLASLARATVGQLRGAEMRLTMLGGDRAKAEFVLDGQRAAARMGVSR